ncbi:MAG: ribonuclease III [Chloroflexota bacterium]
MDNEDLSALQEAMGVSFASISLLEQSLTHSSFAHETGRAGTASNQRLELLGDALIDFIVTEELFYRFPDLREGALTEIRAQLVCQEALASAADSFGLGNYIRLGYGEETSGGRQRPSILASVMEAVVAALYLDRGLAGAREIVLAALSDQLEAVSEGSGKGHKALLQEFLQALGQLPIYEVAETGGPEHDKWFRVVVAVEGKTLGTGRGKSKKNAESEAARVALENLAARSDSG